MSENFFGDDDNDEFELTPGGDSSAPIVPKRPQPARQQRPVGSASARPATNPVRPKIATPPPVATGGSTPAPRKAPPPPTTRRSTPPVPPAPKATQEAPKATQSSVPDRSTGIPAKPVRAMPPAAKQTPAPQVTATPVVVSEPVEVEEHYSEPEQAVETPYSPEYIDNSYSHEEPEDNFIEEEPYVAPTPAPVRREERVRRTEPVAPRIDRAESFENNDNSFDFEDHLSSRNGYKDTHSNEDLSFMDEEEEAPKKRTKRAPAKSKKPTQKKSSTKASKQDKGPGAFAGQRKSVLIVRTIAGLVVLSIMGAGINSMVNPPRIPTQENVKAVVRADLGITAFPTEGASAFVTSFTKEYLTVVPNSRNAKSDALKTYTSDSLALDFASTNSAEAEQTVTEGPIISGVKAVDDENAVYTVSAEVNNLSWLYLEIPVYFDPATYAFSISGTPSFTSPPIEAEAPLLPSAFENDAKLATEVQSNVTSFFKAWATSDEEGLGRYVDEDANIETRSGLQNTVAFVEMTSIEVEQKAEDAPDPKNRKAKADVVWAHPGDPTITYKQTYDLELTQYPDERWYVADITGGTRSTQ